jgi:hypothetical protein
MDFLDVFGMTVRNHAIQQCKRGRGVEMDPSRYIEGKGYRGEISIYHP